MSKWETLVIKIEGQLFLFVKGIKAEVKDTKEAAEIVRKYARDGEITDEEEKILKKHLWDTLKIFGVVVPFIIVPGASIIIPILIKLAKKHNIDLMPSSFSKDKKDPQDGIQTNDSTPT